MNYSLLKTATTAFILLCNAATSVEAALDENCDICKVIAERTTPNFAEYVANLTDYIPDVVGVYCARGGTPIDGSDPVFGRVFLNEPVVSLKMKLDPALKLCLVTHGLDPFETYANSGDWMRRLAVPLAKNRVCNVCIVYWLGNARMPPNNYFQIVKIHVPHIAAYLEKMIKYIARALPSRISEMIFFGHSLGSLMMAQVARIIKDKNERDKIDLLVSMDDAQPCVYWPQQTPDGITGDVARTIQTIHTNAILGKIIPGPCQNIYTDVLVKPTCQRSRIRDMIKNLKPDQQTDIAKRCSSKLLAPLLVNPHTTLRNVLKRCRKGSNDEDNRSILLATSFRLFLALQCTHQYAYELAIWTNTPANQCVATLCPNLLRSFNSTLRAKAVPQELPVGVFCPRQCYENVTYALAMEAAAPYCPANKVFVPATCFIETLLTPELSAKTQTQCTL